MDKVTFICDVCKRQGAVIENTITGEFYCLECANIKADEFIDEKKSSFKKKGPKALRVIGRVGEVFLKGFGHQVTDPGTATISIGVGLHQGLKYNGNIKRGVVTGAVVLGVIGAASGVMNIFGNIDYIKDA